MCPYVCGNAVCNNTFPALQQLLGAGILGVPGACEGWEGVTVIEKVEVESMTIGAVAGLLEFGAAWELAIPGRGLRTLRESVPLKL